MAKYSLSFLTFPHELFKIIYTEIHGTQKYTFVVLSIKKLTTVNPR